MKILDTLKTNRPNLNDSSIKTYASMIRNFLKRIKPDFDEEKLPEDYFEKNSKVVLDKLKDEPLTRRKTILAGIISLTNQNNNHNDVYRIQMLNDIHSYKNEQYKQEMTTKQKENHLSQDEIDAVYRKYQKDYTSLLKKEQLTKQELNHLQDFIILSIYTLIPPRRLVDFTEFRLKDIDTDNHNYYKDKSFVFNTYKTAKTSGTQIVPIPKKLQQLISKYEKLNPYPTLLFDSKGNQLTPAKLNVKINKIFGKKIGVNGLRHTYVTERVLQGMPKLTELMKTAKEMGHSVEQQLLYKKE